MAFPTSNVKFDLATALMRSMARAKQVKQFFTESIANMAAGSVSTALIMAVAEETISTRDFLTTQKALPGMGQYAKDQLNNQVLDIVADANTLISSLDDVAVYLDDNWPPATGTTPVAGTNREGLWFNKTDGVHYELWGTGKSSALRTKMQAVVDAIE